MALIIAEAGVNHNGDESLALKLIDAAHNAGADIVKFQTFKAKNLVTSEAALADYQAVNAGEHKSQLDMLSKLELSYETHYKLLSHCEKLGIEFLSTAFDSESLEFLVNDLGLKRLKIPSGEITNAPLVLQHARTGCDLIVSTGMATLAEIEEVLGVIAFGYTHPKFTQPTMKLFADAYSSKEGQEALQNKVTLLHCTTEYPAPIDEINLQAMDTMACAFKLPTGYSDHSEGIEVSLAAVARGAVLLEKHFTLNKTMDGPDHKASLEPNELELMISASRKIEKSLGDGVKRPTVSELKNKDIARKSIVAGLDILEGEALTIKNIQIKRPGTGKSPYCYWDVLGKKATRKYSAGEQIE